MRTFCSLGTVSWISKSDCIAESRPIGEVDEEHEGEQRTAHRTLGNTVSRSIDTDYWNSSIDTDYRNSTIDSSTISV